MARHNTPTEILQRRGSWRAAGREGEPDFTIAIPPCAEHVTSEFARRWYDEQVAYAAGAGIMTEAYGAAMSEAAYFMSEYVELCAEIKKTGRLYVDDRGNPRKNPLIPLRNESWDRVLKILIQFGYTPAARSAVKVGVTKHAENSLEAFNATKEA